MPTIHEQRAVQIARDIERGITPAPLAHRSARQGDLMLIRAGDAASPQFGPTPAGGVLLAAGAHGEHRLVGRAIAWPADGTVDVPEDGAAVVAHTDVPAARHGAVALAAGRWAWHRLRELNAATAVPEAVRD